MKVKLKQAFDLQIGRTPSRNRPEYWGGQNKWISIADIGNARKYIIKTKECITDEGVTGSKIKKVPKDTVIMSFKLSIGKVAITAEDMFTNEAIIAFIDKGIYKIDSNYLYHLCHGMDWTSGSNKAVMGLTLNKTTLSEKEISIPDITIQRKIAIKLDKIDNIIWKKQYELSKLDQIIQSRFLEMFGDPYLNPYDWKKLKIKNSVTVEPQNGLYKPQSDYVTNGTGTPILRIDGFYDGVVTNFSNLKRLNCENDEKQRYLLYENDIVINRVNSIEYLGKCAHIKGLLEDTVFESNMMRMHFDEKRYEPVYISKLLCSAFMYDQIVNHAKKAVNQASINQKDVLDFDIYQPPLELQNQFAIFVHQIDKLKLAVQKSLEKLEILKKSLMQQYFG